MPSWAFPTNFELELRVANDGSSLVLVAGRSPEGIEQRRLLRLQRAVAAVGVAQVRHLHLPHVRGQAPGPGRAHLLRAQRVDGRLQVGRDRADAAGRQRRVAPVLRAAGARRRAVGRGHRRGPVHGGRRGGVEGEADGQGRGEGIRRDGAEEARGETRAAAVADGDAAERDGEQE